ncbi:MAG: methyl-accepting chemotaxis protein [Lachnospiraceae bacterium]|nr:methyl-accepting chemotaxis protein [Lachnospiraceae bacterium]
MEKKTGFMNSVKTKLIAAMLAVAAIPLAIALIISYTTSTSKSMTDAEDKLQWQCNYIESEFNGIIMENVRSLQNAAANANIVYYMEGNPYGVPDEEVYNVIASVDQILGDGNCTALAGPDGMQLFRTIGKCVDVSDREYFKQGIAGNVYVSDVIVSKSTGTRICTIIVPVIGHEGKPIGTIQRNYDLNVLHAFLKSEADEAFLCDSSGIVTAHSQYEIGVEDVDDRSKSRFMVSGLDEEVYEADTGKGYKAVVSYKKEPISGWTVCNASRTDIINASATRTSMIVLGIGLVMLVIAAAISVFLARSFTAPIKDVNESLAALADGRFVKVNRHTERKDEFGQIVNNSNDVMDKLKAIVSDIKESAVSVNEESVQLAETADQISQTTDDVSNAVQDIAHGATQQADEIQEANNHTLTISDNIQAVSDNAGSVAQTAQEMSENSRVSAEKLEKLKISSEQMEKAIVEISEKISATGASVERISGKVEAINSIASQTNLLALNASIEAARAGEAGRGFAVVAEEIGKLAEESSHAADEIRSEMNLLLNESQSAVVTAKGVTESNKEQKSVIDDTVEAIGSLIEGIENAVAGIDTITNSAEACDASKVVIIDSMSSLSSISEENAASCEQTSASMQELNATVNTLAGAADKLRHISDSLIKEMKFFKD